MRITESKLVYPDFKQIKGIFTSINKAEQIIFYGKNGKVNLLFSKDSNYFILSGSIDSANTEFFKWLIDNDKTVVIDASVLRNIASTLKRDALALDYDDNKFTFVIGTEEVFEEVELTNVTSYENDKTKLEAILSKLVHSKSYSADDEIIKDDILNSFRDDVFV